MTKKAVPMGQIYFLLLFIVFLGYYLAGIMYYNDVFLERLFLGVQYSGNWFVFASIISFIMIAIGFYKNEVIDRVIWAVSLFFTIGSVVFLSNVARIIYYYDLYTWLTLFLSLIFVGIITTLFSSAGFVGVLSEDKKAVWRASLMLLGWTVVCTTWSIWAKRYGVSFLYLTLPIMWWRWAYDVLSRKIRGEKSKSDWSFKW